MSKNIKQFITGRAFDWLAKNSTDPTPLAQIDRSRFWIAPFDLPDRQAMAEAVAPLVEEYASSKILSKLDFDDVRFATLETRGERFTTVSSVKAVLAPPGDLPDATYEVARLSFLLRLDIITAFDLPSKRPIPVRLIVDSVASRVPVFERDLEEFLPDVVAWRSLEDRDEAHEVSYVRGMLALGATSEAILTFRGLLVQLAMSLPRDGHAWLFDQLLRAIASHRPEYLYLELYRLLEFFFPMKGLLALKQRLNFPGTLLELREHCEGSLSWNVNHNFGARMSLGFVSGTFASTCLDKPAPAEGEQEQRRFKEDAMEQIAQLRHKIAHQSFNSVPFEPEGLSRRIEALLIFLTEAFPPYVQQSLMGQAKAAVAQTASA